MKWSLLCPEGDEALGCLYSISLPERNVHNMTRLPLTVFFSVSPAIFLSNKVFQEDAHVSLCNMFKLNITGHILSFFSFSKTTTYTIVFIHSFRILEINKGLESNPSSYPGAITWKQISIPIRTFETDNIKDPFNNRALALKSELFDGAAMSSHFR